MANGRDAIADMSYCLNPKCHKPQNPSNARFCSTCGSRLLLGDRYRALQPISQGGIGRTFLAVDEQDASKSRCIIKQLSLKNQATNNPEKALELFRQHVERLGKLGEHPQLPQLLAYFEPDAPSGTAITPALVQALIEGQSLVQELEREGAFSEARIRQILEALLPVLQFVHEHDVIHRDINPENIICCSLPYQAGSQDQLVLVDFSAAKLTTKTVLAKAGTVIGSAAYAAPEQLMGQAVKSSDLYSLGVTCIHLLTHIHPFDLFNSLEGIWVWQDYLSEPVSEQLKRILNKMLQSAVKQRYQSAAEILQDLQPEKKVVTTPITVAPSSSASSTVVSKILIPTWKCVHTLRGHLSSINSMAFSPDGRMLASGSADKTIKVWKLDNAVVRYTLLGHLSLIEGVVFGIDGRFLASGSWDYTIKLWNLETGELTQTLTGHSGWIKSVAMSPDGKILVSGSADRTIKMWNLDTAQIQSTLSGHTSAVHCVAMSPDGQILASGSADKTIKIWHLGTNEVKATLHGHSETVDCLAFSPSGQILVSGSADQTINVWHLSIGADEQVQNTPLRTLKGHSDAVRSVAISIQGHTLLSGSVDNTLKIWHPGSGGLLHTLTGHTAGITTVAISPDGCTLASGSQDKTIKLWRFE